jgi:site-specific recombinase XerD
MALERQKGTASMAATAPVSILPDSIANLAADFYVSLRAANEAQRTQQTYAEGIAQFDEFLAAKGMPRNVSAIRREHVEAFLDYLLNDKVDERNGRRLRPATAKNRYASLRASFAWAVKEGELKRSPMATMQPPKVDETLTPVLTEDELRRLLKACEGSGFRERRDMAIVRLLIDCGLRRAELAALVVDDVNAAERMLIVRHGKGGKARAVPFGDRTAQALTRYLRARRVHSLAHLPALWLGSAGMPLTESGIAQVVRDRGMTVSPPIDRAKLHPHAFRHAWAHYFRMADGSETDLMTLAGWSSPQMLRRYGASAASARAIATHRRIGVGDRL